MIERISLLQLGDIHFPVFASQWTNVDDKDHGITAGLPSHFSKPIPSLIASAISAEISRSGPSSIVVCGDLTDKGHLEGFDQAAGYIASAIGAAAGPISAVVHLLPGNHDVDLAGDMAFVDLSSDRFSVLQDRLDALSIPLELTMDARESTYSAGSSELYLTSVNSAKANGAPRLFPNVVVQDPVAEALRLLDPENLLTDSKNLIAKVSGSNPMVSIQEILDIPMIDPDDLDSISNRSVGDKAGLLVVAAHHGFLPQATPRFGPYTEMVNGGQVRRRLLALDRPVLYLHGHIHEDSLEVVRGSGSSAGIAGPPVISIAAPLLSEGFNRIDIEFAPGGRVLGLLLYRVRVDRGTGGLTHVPPERIPVAARRTIPIRFRSFFTNFMESRGSSGEDLIAIGATTRFGLTADEVESAIIEAAWSGLIELVSNPRAPFLEQEYTFR